MNIYHYHPETGALLGEGTADPSPLEPGKWLVPAHATAIEPLRTNATEQAVWVNNNWQVQPIPKPEPEPEPTPEPEPPPVLTTEQKLEAAGLTVAELKELFGLN
jgi:hypothetical protein